MNGLAALKKLSLCRGMAWLPFQKLIEVSTILKSLGSHLDA
jgi:hypothetical protein